MLEPILATLRWLTVALAAVLLAQATPAAAQQGDEIDTEAFYRALEPYGRWFEHPRYGHVWAPEVDSEDWRPYTRGNWVHTEEHGWYWESEEPFGWAVYHYGRWFRDEDQGWVWVPGTEWGPAWVAWRHNDEDVGWAPLPPEAEWRDGEIRLGGSFYDSPRYALAWSFVPVALLTAPRIWTRLHAPRRNAHYLGRTRFVPWHRGGGHGFYNSGFDRRRWETVTGQRVATFRIRTTDRPYWDGPRGGRIGNDLRVYRPRVVVVPRSDGRLGFSPPPDRRGWNERWDRNPGGYWNDRRSDRRGGWDDRRPDNRGGWDDRRRDGPPDRGRDGRDFDGRRDASRPQPGATPPPAAQPRAAPSPPTAQRGDGQRGGGRGGNPDSGARPGGSPGGSAPRAASPPPAAPSGGSRPPPPIDLNREKNPDALGGSRGPPLMPSTN